MFTGSFRPWTAGLAVFLLGVLVGGESRAASAACDGEAGLRPLTELAFDEPLAPPSEPDRPVAVDVEIAVVSYAADGPTLEVDLDLIWCDPRLATPSDQPRILTGTGAADRLERMWWPEPAYVGAAPGPEFVSRQLALLPDGTVSYRERAVLTLAARPSVRGYPFDGRTVEVAVATYVWPLDAAVLTPRAAEVLDGAAPGWGISDLRLIAANQRQDADQPAFSGVGLALDLERDSRPILLRDLLPAFLLLGLGWAVLRLRPGSPPRRAAGFGLAAAALIHQALFRSPLPGAVWESFPGAVGLFALAVLAVLAVLPPSADPAAARGYPLLCVAGLVLITGLYLY